MTVLIYETKMVTVNYVFLCAFLFFKSGGEGCQDMAAADVRKNLFVLVEYNGNHSMFPEKMKKLKKMKKKNEKMKKYMNIFFFLKQYISV